MTTVAAGAYKGTRKAWPKWKKRQVWLALQSGGWLIERWDDGWHYAAPSGPWNGQAFTTWGDAATAALAGYRETSAYFSDEAPRYEETGR